MIDSTVLMTLDMNLPMTKVESALAAAAVLTVALSSGQCLGPCWLCPSDGLEVSQMVRLFALLGGTITDAEAGTRPLRSSGESDSDARQYQQLQSIRQKRRVQYLQAAKSNPYLGGAARSATPPSAQHK